MLSSSAAYQDAGSGRGRPTVTQLIMPDSYVQPAIRVAAPHHAGHARARVLSAASVSLRRESASGATSERGAASSASDSVGAAARGALAAVLAARTLEFWTWDTHELCHPARRGWVRFVLLVFNRLELPYVVQQL